jgi:hypothetical protein
MSNTVLQEQDVPRAIEGPHPKSWMLSQTFHDRILLLIIPSVIASDEQSPLRAAVEETYVVLRYSLPLSSHQVLV